MGKKEPKKTRILPSGEVREVKSRTVLRPDVQIHSERLLIPTSLIAHAFQVSMDAVVKWGIKPVVKESTAALLYLPEVIGHRLGYGEDGVQKLNPAQEKALLDKTRRERAEIELQLERGEVVRIGDVCNELEKELITVRQKLIAIPNKLATKLVPVDSPQEIQEILTAAILDALEDLNYGGRITFENSKPDSANAESAPETIFS